MMPLIISDANVIIDLECAGLTGRIFRLDMEIAVPDLLFHDELSERHSDLPALGLRILELSPELIDAASNLCAHHSAAGIYDMFALALALDQGCPLLTGDKILRLLAGEYGVEVFGTLWLMEKLHESRLITLKEMAEAYEVMLDSQRRLPAEEIKKQLTRLRRG